MGKIQISVDRRDILIAIILFLSFILHIIAFWIIYHLNKKVKQIESTNPNEVMELLQFYLDEIKKENKQLKSNLDHNASAVGEMNTDNIAPLEKQNNIQYVQEQQGFPLNIETDIDDHVEASIEARVLHLYHQNIDASEIAQILNCGKTEVDLIIKFHKKRINT